MIKDIKKVVVKFNDRIVGYLVELENKKIAFQYDDKWIENGFSISPLSLPLSNKIYISNKDQFEGLYGVFWDSIPDGWGELLITRLLSKKGIDFKKLSPLTKLTLINNNGLGGLDYEPYQPLLNNDEKIDLDKISNDVKKILNDENDENLEKIYTLGGSSGGARPKAHINIDGEEWIIKFPCKIDSSDIGEKEYKVNSLAKKCGINVNEFKLFPSKECSGYFGAKRFDRKNSRKLHVISLAGMLEVSHKVPNLDYGHMFDLVENINGSKEELYECFSRMTFNVLIGNKDDHSKNFSFIYDEGIKKYKLSPAYDLTITNDKYEHEMTVNRNGNPTENDLLCLAKDFNLSKKRCIEIINKIKAILKNEI